MARERTQAYDMYDSNFATKKLHHHVSTATMPQCHNDFKNSGVQVMKGGCVLAGIVKKFHLQNGCIPVPHHMFVHHFVMQEIGHAWHC